MKLHSLRINFFKEDETMYFVGLLETSDVEEIKEQALTCSYKQTPLC